MRECRHISCFIFIVSFFLKKKGLNRSTFMRFCQIHLYITSHGSISMCPFLRIAIYTQVHLYRTFGISSSIGEFFKQHERKGRGALKSDLSTPLHFTFVFPISAGAHSNRLSTPLRREENHKKQAKGRIQIRFEYAPAFYFCFPYQRRGALKSDLSTPLHFKRFALQ